jgi:pilus assembly protein CpaF
VASAVNIVVQVNRMSDGTRKVTSIAEITGMEQDVITMQEIFTFTKSGLTDTGAVMGAFKATGVRPKCSDQLKTAGHALPMEMFEHVHHINMAAPTRPSSMAGGWR